MEGCLEYRVRHDDAAGPYEVLMRSIAYQSISTKAATTIFGRVKALGSNGRAPTPEEMLRGMERSTRQSERRFKWSSRARGGAPAPLRSRNAEFPHCCATDPANGGIVRA